MAGRQQIEIWQGEDRTLTFDLTDGGAPLDLTGWTLSWRVWRKGNDNVLTETVTLAGDPTTGRCSVALSATDTALAPGTYQHEMRRTNASSVTTVFVGDLIVKDSPFTTP